MKKGAISWASVFPIERWAILKSSFILLSIITIILFMIRNTTADESSRKALHEAPACCGERPSFEEGPVSFSGQVLIKGIGLFRNTISRVDGDRCPSYPTCARYGEMAIRKHGAIIGLLMIVDRLIHETSEGKYAPRIQVHGQIKIYDPPENNDFWFSR